MTIAGRIKRLLRAPADMFTKALLAREFRNQKSRPLNERPVEYAYLFRQIGRAAPQKVLDVGAGSSALPALIRNCGCAVWATDNVSDYWKDGMVNRHYHVIDDDILDSRIAERFDLVACISTLEHIREHGHAVASMARLLKGGGHLVMSFPYCEDEYIGNAYTLPGSRAHPAHPFITQIFSRREIDAWKKHNHLTLLDQEYWRFFNGRYWSVGEPLGHPEQVGAGDRHQLTCLTLRRDD